MAPRIFFGILLCALACPALSQIAGDGSLGTAINRSGNAWSISAGTRLGGNLFHSFSQFGIPTGNSATFSGPNSVANIVGRVTGPNASSIDGLLRSTIPGANLWLMNPKGVMFGPNASLDIGGSFHVSTADYLKLGGGAGIFYAALAANSTLSSAPPGAFGFLGPVRAPISINGASLQPFAGGGLSLTGGDILLTDATLLAPNGRIEIAGSSLRLQNSTLDTVTTGSARSGDIRIVTGDMVLAGGSVIEVSTSGAGQAGNVEIVASGRLSIAHSDIYADSNGAHTGNGGAISISASAIDIGGGSLFGSDTYGAANAGSLTMAAKDISLTGGSQIGSTTWGKGHGGTVTIQAAGSLSISGTSGSGYASGIFAGTEREAPGGGNAGSVSVTAGSIRLGESGLISTETFGYGNAGNIRVTAGALEMTGGSQITSSTFGYGNAGNIRVTAGALEMTGGSQITSSTSGYGNAGNIRVTAGALEMTGGSHITSSTSGAGRGGNIDVAVSGRLSVAGADANDIDVSGISSSTHAGSTGQGGSVTVSAGSLSLDESGEIAADTAGAGRAGDISVSAGSISLTNGGRISSSTIAAGQGGNVTVVTPGQLFIAGYGSSPAANGNSGSGIYADTGSKFFVLGATGNGGSVSVNAGFIDLQDGGLISAVTGGAGHGGEVSIVSPGRLSIAGIGRESLDTGITTTTWSSGAAGSIRIRVAELALDGHTQTQILSAAHFGSGVAGSIVIDTGSATIAGQAHVSTSARGSGGRAGSIVFTASGDVLLVGDPAAAARHGGISTNGIYSYTEGAGAGGTIVVSARNLSITDGAEIGVSSVRTGNAGNIFLDVANALRLSGGGSVTTSARSADGGNIIIKAGKLVYLRDSQITTSVNTSTGSGGNITIDPVFVVLDHSQIIAQAAQGRGGNIGIVSEFFLSFDSLVDASSQKGISGSVLISSPNVDVGAGLVVFSGSYLDASNLLRASCAARAGNAAANSFTGVGRGGMAHGPQAAYLPFAGSGAAADAVQLSLRAMGCGG